MQITLFSNMMGKAVALLVNKYRDVGPGWKLCSEARYLILEIPEPIGTAESVAACRANIDEIFRTGD